MLNYSLRIHGTWKMITFQPYSWKRLKKVYVYIFVSFSIDMSAQFNVDIYGLYLNILCWKIVGIKYTSCKLQCTMLCAISG